MIKYDKIGFVETPPEIAELMVKLSNIPKNGLILDTGCGEGVFLEILRKMGYTNCVGIEIDPEACNFCRSKFKEFKIIQGDYLSYSFDENFDLIIGNPPYAHFNQLPIDIANKVKSIIKTSEGDIYYAFIIKSINLLKESGELIYITPYHFFYNTYAKFVRENILKFGKIEIIIDLDEVRLFKYESPETIIFKFRKGKFECKREKIKLLNITTRKTNPHEIKINALKALQLEQSNELFEFTRIPHYTDSNPWSSFFISIPNFPYILLKDIAKVGVGLVSGFDKAFLLSAHEFLELNNKEKSFVKNFVKAKNCKRFIVEGSAQYILIDDVIKNEKLLPPNIYKKMIRYKEKMKHRYLPKGKKWFNWQALRNYKFLISNINKKRIYVPTLDRHPYNRFSLGSGGLFPSGDVLFIQPSTDEDLYYLLGYLNSTFFRKYYLANGGRRGGRVAFTQRLLENMKIPLFSNEVKNKIKEITAKIIYNLENNQDTSDLEKELDALIYESFKKEKFEGKHRQNSNLFTFLTTV